MTRLEEFAERVLAMILDEADENGEFGAAERATAAALLAREVREFSIDCADWSLGNSIRAGEWLDAGAVK